MRGLEASRIAINSKDKDTITDLTFEGFEMASLLHLSLAQCTMVTDNGLSAIMHGCPKLRTLNLRDCISLTDDGLSAHVHRCPLLQEIDLFNVDRIRVYRHWQLVVLIFRSLISVLLVTVGGTQVQNVGRF